MKLLNPADVSRMLKVSRPKVKQLAEDGFISWIDLDGEMRFDEETLRSEIEALTRRANMELNQLIILTSR